MADETKRYRRKSPGYRLYLMVEHLRANYAAKRLKVQEIVDKLFSETPEADRCPHLRRDSKSAYCSNGLQPEGFVSDKRRMVCDTSSLQLWCLDKKRCSNCICYKDYKEFLDLPSLFCDVAGR